MRFLLILLALASAQFADAAPARAGPGGTLVIVGGGLSDDNDAVWTAIVSAAGGAGASIAVIPAASANPEGSGRAAEELLARSGAAPFVVPLAAAASGAFGPAEASSAEWSARVAAAGGIYFTGGAQSRLVSALKPDGAESALLVAIRGVLARGGVIAGTSAGAAVMSRVMFTDPAGADELLRRGARKPDDVGPGLGFLRHDWMIDQHFLARGRHERAFAATCATGARRLIGIDEDTALVVRGSQASVVGRSGVMAMLTKPPRACAPFPSSSARIHVLFDGDTLDLGTGRAAAARNGAVQIDDEAVQALVSAAANAGRISIRETEAMRWLFDVRHTPRTSVADGQTVINGQLNVALQRTSR